MAGHIIDQALPSRGININFMFIFNYEIIWGIDKYNNRGSTYVEGNNIIEFKSDTNSLYL